MKVWFMKLGKDQRKSVYTFTIIVSVISFFSMIVSPICGLFWIAALVAVLTERKIIKTENKRPEEKVTEKKDRSTVSDENEREENRWITAPSTEEKNTITIEHNREKRESFCELSHLECSKPAGELGCFLNYEPHILCPPTERQLAYLNDLGVFIPDGITKEDASCMISRATGEDSMEGPSRSLVELADGLNVKFSAFIGNRGIFREIVYTSNYRDRAALYAYAVRQNLHGESFGNMLADSEVSVFYAFADQVIATPTLLRSLLDRTSDDYKKPYRGTKIYKAAVEFLNIGTITQ